MGDSNDMTYLGVCQGVICENCGGGLEFGSVALGGTRWVTVTRSSHVRDTGVLPKYLKVHSLFLISTLTVGIVAFQPIKSRYVSTF